MATLTVPSGYDTSAKIIESGENASNSGFVKAGTVMTINSYSANRYYEDINSITIAGTGGLSDIREVEVYSQSASLTMASTDSGIEKHNSTGCFVEGTMILMADGTTKLVELLQLGDKVIVFNHLTGEYEVSEIWMMLHADLEREVRKVVNLNFSDGSTLRITYEHGLFDRTINRYVFITEENVGMYVGHKFSAVDVVNGEYLNKVVTLSSYSITQEETKVYSPVTSNYMNLVAENMLTVTPMFDYADAFVNVFEYNDDMTYNMEKMLNDIETYGIFSYDDFKDLIPYEVYEDAPVAYLKVAIAKGLITYDGIKWIIGYLTEGGYLVC